MNTSHSYSIKLLTAGCTCALALIGTEQAVAAEGAKYQGIEEIIVTARKQKESLLKVPVTETVLTPVRLQNLHVTQMTDLPKLIPGMVIGHNVLSNGTVIAIRGVGTTTLDAGVDPTVAFNLDGLDVANGLAFQSGTFDLGQIEVLKGPQALFYGKSSPGGVISMTTADPTDEVEVLARAGYETEAETYRGEFIASGPVSDTLGLRLAAMYSQSDGYFDNKGIPDESTGSAAPPSGHEPDAENYIVRGTALWNPSERFNARVKVNFVHDDATNPTEAQFTNCPDGTAPLNNLPLPYNILFPPSSIDFLGGGEDCKLDDTVRVVSYDPAAFPGIQNGGHPYSDTDQFFTTAEWNYDFTPELTLTSVTGWYDLDSDSLVNTTNTTHAAPLLSAGHTKFTNTNFTQELRLASNFSTPLNFTLGAFYQDAEIQDRVVLIANRATAAFIATRIDQDVEDTIDINSWSVFGQLKWQFAPNWEFAAGARYSDESRDQDLFNFLTGTEKPHVDNNFSDTNVSPEATLTYQLSDDITVYAAYKEGFKSGAFGLSSFSGTCDSEDKCIDPNAVPPDTNPTHLPKLDNAFDSEEVKGGELGLKSILMDRELRFNVSGYYYDYDGLQVGAIEPRAGTVGVKTLNAGGTEVYGVDMDAEYLPAAAPGLTLNVAVEWNHGRYTDLKTVPCWGGQLISEGCDQVLNPSTGLYTAEDLSGEQMVRAPEWQGNFGVTYELPVGNGYTLEFSNNNSYTDEYPTYLAINRPNNDNWQDSFWKVDLGVTLRGPDDRFELALIGKNITDEIIGGFCGASPYQTGAVIPVTIKGGTVRGPDGVDENQCFSDPGREIWLRLSYKLL